MSPRIAVIDDEPIILDLLYELLTEEGYTPHVFADGNRAWPHLRARAPCHHPGPACRATGRR